MRASEWVKVTVHRLVRDEDGPTATEYAILLGLIVLGAMAAIRAVGTRMDSLYEAINARVSPVIS